MLTPFGKAVRKLRINKGVNMAQMARNVACSPSFISMVENGKKDSNPYLVSKIARYFKLSEEEELELNTRAQESAKEVCIDLQGLDGRSRYIAVQIATQFRTLNWRKKQAILDLL